MTNSNSRAPALARVAEAMLRALGGAEVKFCCPVAAAQNEQARQLGLDAPVTEDIGIAPVVVRDNGADLELLIAPSSLAQFLQDRGQKPEQFFNAILAVFVGGRELHVKLFHVEQFAGSAYLYRLTVVANS